MREARPRSADHTRQADVRLVARNQEASVRLPTAQARPTAERKQRSGREARQRKCESHTNLFADRSEAARSVIAFFVSGIDDGPFEPGVFLNQTLIDIDRCSVSQTKRVDQGRERGGLIAATWVIQKIAGKYGTPVS